MPGLLDQSEIDAMTSVARRSVRRNVELLRAIMWRGVPPGMVRLDDEQKRSTMRRHLEVRARQEQAGTVPGDVNTATLANPAVVEATDHA